MQNEKAYELVTTGLPRSPGLPCAMVLTGSSALSLVTGLVCHHRKRKISSANLNASVGASGPHGFAVRVNAPRPAHHPRPPHPAPNVRDDREPPLLRERDGNRYASDLGFLKIRIFLREGLDMPLSDLPVGQSKEPVSRRIKIHQASFRDAPSWRGPGIHNHDWGLWILGSALCRVAPLDCNLKPLGHLPLKGGGTADIAAGLKVPIANFGRMRQKAIHLTPDVQV
jgi:hypothetical protein